MSKRSMDVQVKRIAKQERELVEIQCHEIDERVKEIIRFVKSRQGQITGNIAQNQYEIPITDVYYIESVDNRSFIYTAKQVYETKERLYELEQLLEKKHFLRVSKSSLVNLMKVSSIKPALNGRFTAILLNGEELIISRKYVSALKQILKGGNVS